MHEAYAGAASPANSGGAETGIGISVSGKGSPLSVILSDLLKSKFPRKTWAHLADFLGCGERVAKHRLANTRSFTVEELQALLQSEEGLDFLVAVMADARPQWWAWALKVMTLANVRKRQHDDQQTVLQLEATAIETGSRRRIRNALNANASLSASLARAETTLGIQRADMDRRADHAARPNARAPHRAMAAKGGRR